MYAYVCMKAYTQVSYFWTFYFSHDNLLQPTSMIAGRGCHLCVMYVPAGQMVGGVL